jgi:phosphatidylglycerol:prolipoprotein diacylglycerol transferase
MHPILTIGAYAMSTYVLAHVVYFLLAPPLTAAINARRGIPRRVTLTAFALGVPVGLLGAHFLALFEHRDFYAQHPELVGRVWSGGSAIFGGLFAGVLAAACYTRWRGIPLRRFLDGCAPAMALGEAITRVGCFLGGCCHGVPTSSLLGVRFPRQSPVFSAHVQSGLISYYDAHTSLPVHPTQLYSVAFALVAFVIALRLLRDRERPDGQVFAAFYAAYGVWRLLLFPLRDDPGAPLLLNLASSQIWSIAAIATALALWPRRRPTAEENAALASAA